MRQGPWKLIVNRARLDSAKARKKTEPPTDAALFDLDSDLGEKTGLASRDPDRVVSMNLDQGQLHIAWQIPEVKNHTRDMHQPVDISQSVLRVTPDTRVSNADQPVALTELKPGDILRMNLTSEQKGHPAHCTDLWITDATGNAAAKAPNETRSAGVKQANPDKRK